MQQLPLDARDHSIDEVGQCLCPGTLWVKVTVPLPVFLRADRQAAHNLQQVSFEEAATVLADPWALPFDDLDPSSAEQRFITIGESHRGRIVFVAHTDRDDLMRIISARVATRPERRAYANERRA